MLYSDFFHQLAKGHGQGHQPIPSNSEDWPEEWKTIFYKVYPHAAHIELERPPIADSGLFQTIAHRQSSREFLEQPISREDLSKLFLYSCGVQQPDDHAQDSAGLTPSQHRAQPSGGGRFPLEAYFLNFIEGEIPAGVFHYDVKHHQLDVLEKRSFSKAEIGNLFVYSYVREASGAVILTATGARSQMKYGERGYRYMLLEAGHIGQNISLVGRAAGLKTVMMGGTVDGAIEKLLDIDGVTESLVYGSVIGH